MFLLNSNYNVFGLICNVSDIPDDVLETHWIELKTTQELTVNFSIVILTYFDFDLDPFGPCGA